MTQDYKILKANNEKIGRWMMYEPEIEYSVGTNDSYCYNPKQIGYGWHSDQKRECERWLKEMPQLAEQGYFVRRDENWPYFHQDWNELIKVVERIEVGNFGIKMCRKVVEIYYDDTKEVILKVKESSRTTSAYTAIIQFIDWHNAINKRQHGDK